MSRSYRKTRILGLVNVRDSQKQDKQFANRSLRRAVRQLIPQMDNETHVLPIVREVSNVYGWSHDGKHWVSSDSFWIQARRWK